MSTLGTMPARQGAPDKQDGMFSGLKGRDEGWRTKKGGQGSLGALWASYVMTN